MVQQLGVRRVSRAFLTNSVQNRVALTGTIPNMCRFKSFLYFFFRWCQTRVDIFSFDLTNTCRRQIPFARIAKGVGIFAHGVASCGNFAVKMGLLITLASVCPPFRKDNQTQKKKTCFQKEGQCSQLVIHPQSVITILRMLIISLLETYMCELAYDKLCTFGRYIELMFSPP